jgi:hypothetical protein
MPAEPLHTALIQGFEEYIDAENFIPPSEEE